MKSDAYFNEGMLYIPSRTKTSSMRQQLRRMGSDRMGVGGDSDRFDGARVRRDEADSDHDQDDVVMNDDDDGRPTGNQNQRRRGGRAATSARDRFLSDDTDIEEEMMRIDPVDLAWRRQLHDGDPIDSQNAFGNWCPAMALRILDGEVRVRYLNMNDSWQRWLPLDSGQIAQPATKTFNDSAPLRLAQVVEVRKSGSSFWKEALVVKARPTDVLVRYAGRELQFDEWMPFTPDNVAAAGDHIRTRRVAGTDHLRFSAKLNAANRLRVIQAQNPRFQHYRVSLAAHGLSIHAVEGDGNCLFRSVSHQIYGNDAHHGIVRHMCMAYMESEKEYFEPYVVGDMSAFLRYLEHKRRDGVWGDDPEIQAMCELYDRPAEVYAYDPAHGFRKLRTFHETSSSRHRPPICLSYYGGGHYDSIVSAHHAANLVREPPGEWERRHIEISRRINTREGLSTADAAGSILAQRVAASGASTDAADMAQLEQILLMSRNEFDAMRSNLDDTLRMAMAESEASAVDSEQRALDAATQESEMAAIQAELLAKAQQASEDEHMRQALEASMQGHGHGDFDADVSAAIHASLAEHASAPTASHAYDPDDEMRRILELSAKEYEDAAMAPTVAGLSFDLSALDGHSANADEMDELQRAIQASLRDA